MGKYGYGLLCEFWIMVYSTIVGLRRCCALNRPRVKAGLLYGRIYGIAIIVKKALCRVPSLLSSILRLPL